MTRQAVTMLTNQDQELTEIEEIHSIVEYTFEEFYLAFYIASGKKSESYSKACYATDYEQPNNLKQSAWSYHKGLEKKGLVESALLNATLMDRINSRLKLNELRDHAESETVQLAAAKHTSGSLYSNESASQGVEVVINRDNVQITQGNQTLTIEDE